MILIVPSNFNECVTNTEALSKIIEGRNILQALTAMEANVVTFYICCLWRCAIRE